MIATKRVGCNDYFKRCWYPKLQQYMLVTMITAKCVDINDYHKTC